MSMCFPYLQSNRSPKFWKESFYITKSFSKYKYFIKMTTKKPLLAEPSTDRIGTTCNQHFQPSAGYCSNITILLYRYMLQRIVPRICSCSDSCNVVFRWYSVRMSAGTPAILTEIFRGFPQPIYAKSGIVLKFGHNPSFHVLPNSSATSHFTIRRRIVKLFTAS
jgi:hypothetical protein